MPQDETTSSGDGLGGVGDGRTGGDNHQSWQRLHPLGLARHLKPLSAGLVALALRRADFAVLRWWSTGADLRGPWEFAITGVLLVYGLVNFARFKFMISPTEVVVKRGLLLRETARLRLDNLQQTEVTRSVLHRTTGTARVVISATAGTSSIELNPLGFEQAKNVVAQLSLSARSSPARGDLPTNDQDPSRDSQKVLRHEPALRRVALASFLSSHLVLTLLLFVLFRILWPSGSRFASTVVMMAVVVAVIRMVRYSGFSAVIDHTTIRTQHGRTTKVDQQVPWDAVRAVIVRRGWLHRLVGVETVELSLGADDRNARLLSPACATGEGIALLEPAFGMRIPSEASLLRPHLRSAIRVRIVGAVVGGMAIAASAVWRPRWTAAVAVVASVAVWVYPSARRLAVGIQTSDGIVLATSGLLNQRLLISRASEIVEVAISQSLTQRPLGLASLRFCLVGPHNIAWIRDLDESSALEIAARMQPSGPLTATTARPGDAELPLEIKISPRAVAAWRSYGIVLAVVVTAIGVALLLLARRWTFLPSPPVWGVLIAGVLASLPHLLLAEKYHEGYGVSVGLDSTVVQSGHLIRRLSSVRHASLVAVRSAGDPIETRLGLASVTLAPPGSDGQELVIPGLEKNQADLMSEFISRRIDERSSAASEEGGQR